MANENWAESTKAAQQRTNAKLIGLLKKYTPTKSGLEQPQFKLKEDVPSCFNPYIRIWYDPFFEVVICTVY